MFKLENAKIPLTEYLDSNIKWSVVLWWLMLLMAFFYTSLSKHLPISDNLSFPCYFFIIKYKRKYCLPVMTYTSSYITLFTVVQ